jgi:hypothetical protein
MFSTIDAQTLTDKQVLAAKWSKKFHSSIFEIAADCCQQ